MTGPRSAPRPRRTDLVRALDECGLAATEADGRDPGGRRTPPTAGRRPGVRARLDRRRRRISGPPDAACPAFVDFPPFVRRAPPIERAHRGQEEPQEHRAPRDGREDAPGAGPQGAHPQHAHPRRLHRRRRGPAGRGAGAVPEGQEQEGRSQQQRHQRQIGATDDGRGLRPGRVEADRQRTRTTCPRARRSPTRTHRRPSGRTAPSRRRSGARSTRPTTAPSSSSSCTTRSTATRSRGTTTTAAKDKTEMDNLEAIAKKYQGDEQAVHGSCRGPPPTVRKFPDGKHVALTRWSADAKDPGDQSKQRGNWQYCGSASGAVISDFFEAPGRTQTRPSPAIMLIGGSRVRSGSARPDCLSASTTDFTSCACARSVTSTRRRCRRPRRPRGPSTATVRPPCGTTRPVLSRAEHRGGVAEHLQARLRPGSRSARAAKSPTSSQPKRPRHHRDPARGCGRLGHGVVDGDLRQPGPDAPRAGGVRGDRADAGGEVGVLARRAGRAARSRGPRTCRRSSGTPRTRRSRRRGSASGFSTNAATAASVGKPSRGCTRGGCSRSPSTADRRRCRCVTSRPVLGDRCGLGHALPEGVRRRRSRGRRRRSRSARRGRRRSTIAAASPIAAIESRGDWARRSPGPRARRELAAYGVLVRHPGDHEDPLADERGEPVVGRLQQRAAGAGQVVQELRRGRSGQRPQPGPGPAGGNDGPQLCGHAPASCRRPASGAVRGPRYVDGVTTSPSSSTDGSRETRVSRW